MLLPLIEGAFLTNDSRFGVGEMEFGLLGCSFEEIILFSASILLAAGILVRMPSSLCVCAPLPRWDRSWLGMRLCSYAATQDLRTVLRLPLISTGLFDDQSCRVEPLGLSYSR
jgi:hypothetical protein